MSNKKKLKTKLTLISAIIISSSGYAVEDVKNMYSSSANITVDWHINQQSIDTGRGIILKVPPTAFKLSFDMTKTYASSQQPISCYNLNNSALYNFRLNSLPNIVHSLTNNIFIKWSGVKSEISASATPIKDANTANEQSADCLVRNFEQKHYTINNAKVTKNGKPFASLQSLEINKEYQVDGDNLSVNVDFKAQDLYVLDLNKHYGPANLTVKFNNLNTEIAKTILDKYSAYDHTEATNSELMFFLENLPLIVNEDSNVTWEFSANSQSGRTVQNGKLSLSTLVDSYLKLSTIGNLTLNMLSGANASDLISMMAPKADAFKGEISMQMPTEDLQDAINLALKSSRHFQDENLNVTLSKASPFMISNISNNLLNLALENKLAASTGDTVKFAYKFQDGKIQNENLKLKISNHN